MGDARHLTVIAAGYAAGIVIYSALPGPYLSIGHPAPLVRLLIAFALPTAAGIIYGLLRRLWLRDRVRGTDPALESTCNAIVFRVLLFMFALHALILTALAGTAWIRPWAGRGVLVLVGLLLVGVGNLLPRTRPNVVIGIRTFRALTDRRMWMRTHRVSGYVAVGLGAVVACAGAFLSGPTLPRLIGTATAIAATLIAISYYRRADV
jgi:uncharacterized membrane protein